VTNSTFSSNTAGGTGGGIGNRGTLNVENSTFSGNTATGAGGGIYSQNTLTVTNSTFSGNTASNGGGGIDNLGTLNVTNSTFYNNSTTGTFGGGGIYSQSTLTVTNSTFSDNSATTDGGGIHRQAGTATLYNTIVADSTGADCSAGVTADAFNLDSDGTCNNATASATINLGPLADNGGSTQTMALGMGSTALNAGDNAVCPAADQRGVTRAGDSACDVGAWEHRVVTLVADTDDGTCDADCTLREAIDAANTLPGADLIMFVVDGTVDLSSTLPALNDDVAIDGTGHTVTVSGGGSVRVMEVSSGKMLILYGITIANGLATDGGGGGGILNKGGTLMVTNSLIENNLADDGSGGGSGGGFQNQNSGISTFINTEFRGNQAKGANDDGGGAVMSYSGVVTLMNVTLDGNSSATYGGGLRNFDVLTVINSTFSNNTAADEGGGVFNSDTATMTLSNSTVFSNTGTYGGGIRNWGVITITNSTVSDNEATQDGGGLRNDGSAYVYNTILANSVNSEDCIYGGTAQLTDNENNLIETGNCSAAAVSDDPKLGPLQDNGGSTWTMALMPGSPALDAGKNATCAATPISNKDQRGITRPQHYTCDIGAFEAVLRYVYLPLVIKNH
jgi:CSLREA domain-containing protein